MRIKKGDEIMVKNHEIPKEFHIFKCIWNIFKKYYDAPNTDETWESFLAEVNETVRENGNSFLARKLGLAILECKEHECRELENQQK